MRDPDHIARLSADVSMSFQRIPSGAFLMGSRGMAPDEEPRHEVRITRPFYLGTYPVTQAQFAVWRPDHQNRFTGLPDHPAENLSWDDASAYCAWLAEAHGTSLPAGHVATLPTEAEWEYACRAGTESEYHSGNGEAALREAGWFDEDLDTGSTHPVGLKAANAFGLHDVHGNVWEWCWDVYHADAYKTRVDGVADPGSADRGAPRRGRNAVRTSVEGAPDRVFRGGSWGHAAWDCRSACRDWWWPGNRYGDQGFRVCLVPGP